jgi:hypothetical protein
MLYRWQSVFGTFGVQERGWFTVPAISQRGRSFGRALVTDEGQRSRYVSIVHSISLMNSPRHVEQLIHRYDYLTTHDPERSQVTERNLSFSDRSRNPRWVADVTSCCYRSSDPRLESRHPNDITHNTIHTIQKEQAVSQLDPAVKKSLLPNKSTRVRAISETLHHHLTARQKE